MAQYRFEFNGNPEYTTVHVSERLTDQPYSVSQTFMHKGRYTQEDMNLYALLMSVEGVTEIRIGKYNVSIKRGCVYSKQEICESVIEAIKGWVKMQTGVTDWKQQPTYRQDLAIVQCPECVAEQERAIRESMRDFETTDLE